MSFDKIQRIEYLDPTINLSHCELTEKIDGSQISWHKTDNQLYIHGKNTQIYPSEQPIQKTYKGAVEHLLSVQASIIDNTYYYGEALQIPRHNAIKYDRIPKGHIVLWAVKNLDGLWQNLSNLEAHANTIGIECSSVPKQENGQTISQLGGIAEGVVYSCISEDKKTITKYKDVAESFLEVKKDLKERKKAMRGVKNDAWAEFKDRFRTQARWDKSIQHLRDAGVLTNTEGDIGLLFKEVMQDILLEETKTIEEFFNKTFRKELLKHATTGLADYYKEFLKTVL